MTRIFAVPLAFASLTLAGCAYGDATGYAPRDYPAGYDAGMSSGLLSQPSDRFGGQNVASIEAFTAPLSPYGQWVNSKYGRAFRPDAPQNWRPYVNGRWGENRIWISDDPWGWATDHYGRWGFDNRVGWVWVPGTEWAPSWVAWREDPSQNVTGWAPVPPGVNYSLSLGFGSGFGYDNYNSWYGPSWVWVPQNYLYQPRFGGRVLPWHYGANYWGGSQWQYQPGFGGRPNGYRNYPGGNWQGSNWQGRRGYAQRSQRGWPEGENWQGQPQSGYGQSRPQDGGWQGRPGEGNRNGYSRGNGSGQRGVFVDDGGTRAPTAVERPVMTYADRLAPPPAAAPRAEPRQNGERPAQPQNPPPSRSVERQELQSQMQAQSMQRNNEGNTRPD